MESLVIVLILLTIGIIMLVSIIVWRDRRELKLRQIINEIVKVEEAVREVYKIKEEMENMLAAVRKHTDFAVSQVEGQMKQVKNSVANLEQRLHLVTGNGEKKESVKEKGGKSQTRNKSRTNNREVRQRVVSSSESTKPDMVKINDGEKYSKLYELAEKGLSTQEIAQQLNLGQDEVELVLELKGKKLS